MTVPKSGTPTRARTRRRPPDPTRLVKTLVTIVDGTPGDGASDHPVEVFDLPNYWAIPPQDGEPVGIPTPCARLRAGYWCECGGSFRTLVGGVPASRARVALVEMPVHAERVAFVDGQPSETFVPAPSPWEQDDLVALLDALDVGTVVERRGIGFAPLYRPTAAGARAWERAPW